MIVLGETRATRATGWAMVVVSLAALGSIRGEALAARAVAVSLAGPAFRRFWPGRVHGLAAGICGLVAAPLLFGRKLDLLAMILVGFFCGYFDEAERRVVAASLGCMTLAGLIASDGGAFGAWVVVYASLVLVRYLVLQASRSSRRGEPLFVDRRDVIRLVAVVALAIGTGLASMIALPRTERWLVERQLTSISRVSGFSPMVDLRSLSAIKTSQSVALRVHGSPGLLRGQVYSRYRDGRWLASRPGPFVAVHDPGAPPPAGLSGGTRVESELDGGLIAFAPLDTVTVHAPGCALERNRGRIFRSTGGAIETYVYYPGTRVTASEEEPSAADHLDVPAELAPRLRSLAEGWTRGASGERERAGALLARLQVECSYTLDPEPEGKDDPIIHFLSVSRKGHCELFAASMALLLRCAGIRSRYVSGYSVTERNPFGDYLTARDADAHAWVEAWHGGLGWVTYDPTPPDWQAHAHPAGWTWLSGAWDHVLRIAGRVRVAVGARAAELLRGIARGLSRPPVAVLLVIAALWAAGRRRKGDLGPIASAFRRIVALLGARRPGAGTSRSEPGLALERLERLASRLGVFRPPTMTPFELLAAIERHGQPAAVLRAGASLVDAIARSLYRRDPWDAEAAEEHFRVLESALETRRR